MQHVAKATADSCFPRASSRRLPGGVTESLKRHLAAGQAIEGRATFDCELIEGSGGDNWLPRTKADVKEKINQ